MAKDVLKKDAARNSQPPDSAPVPGIEGAYGHKGEVTTSNEVAFETGERHGAKQGVLSTQKEVGAQSYPGRSCPTPEPVQQATVQTGVAKACSETQLDSSNRHETNSHVASEGR